MTTPVRQEILHMLEALSKCCPEVRFGQLVANLSYLAKGPTNEAIWDVEDEEFLAVLPISTWQSALVGSQPL